ncbi:hypothetical protein CYMTET_19049 [Cymbomonas tetramitiformis]|uniref:Apple domain-containing protein n=1 Tax=Cymbomonas tetramitiformis TaxID=36881 RepID=A0AAE0G6W0_9CHLO|nr:hypothetical protein CYMTET_19049 [Cymbomonas tetramitiformis]
MAMCCVVQGDTWYQLLKSGVECNSGDTSLGTKASVEDCAAACHATSGCTYFVFGTGSKSGACYEEDTTSPDCSEGWESDSYDFYSLAGNEYRAPLSFHPWAGAMPHSHGGLQVLRLPFVRSARCLPSRAIAG